jgi:hypothetical protein
MKLCAMLPSGQMFGILPSNRQCVPDMRAKFCNWPLVLICLRSTHYFLTHYEQRVSICGSRHICAIKDFPCKLKSEIATEDAPCAFFLAAALSVRGGAEKVFIAAALSRFCSLIAFLLRRQTDNFHTHTHLLRCLTLEIISLLAAAFPPEAN